MLFAVSRNDIGRFPALKIPKKQRSNATIVLFRVPVLPMIFNTNFGIHCACLRNSISGVRKVNASRTRINIFGMIGFFWGYMFVAHMVKPRKQNVYYFSPCAEKKIVLWIVAAALLAFDALFLCPGFYF